MTLIGFLAAMLSIIGMMFKIMHWPLAGILILTGIGLFAVFFMPVYGYKLFSQINGTKSKLIGIAGAILFASIAAGALFKIMHWPGAALMLTIQFLVFALFICPILMIQKVISVKTFREKMLHITWYLSVTITTLGYFFKIMHWPGAGPLLILSVLMLAAGYLPLAFKQYNNDQNRTKLYSRFVLIPVVMTYAMLNASTVSKDIFNAFNLIETGNEQTTDHIKIKNNVLFENFPKGTNDRTSLYYEKAKKIKELANDEHKYIADLKLYLMRACDGSLNELPDDSVKLAYLNAKDNYDVPTSILIGDIYNPRTGAWSALELKGKIENYRQDLINMFEGDAKKNVEKFIGLTTNDEYAPNDEQMVSWEFYNFYHSPMAVLVNLLSKLQNDVLYAESVALEKLQQESEKELAVNNTTMVETKTQK